MFIKTLPTYTFQISCGLWRIRKYLTAESTKGAVISLVTSRFDYCNGLLCGIPEELICKLQRVQNNAASKCQGDHAHKEAWPYHSSTKGTSLVTSQEENWIQDSAPGVQVFAWNCTLLPEGNAERICPTTDTEINIQELTLRAENQHENLRWQII